jgi:carbamoyl-phosphate synthase large subunit
VKFLITGCFAPGTSGTVASILSSKFSKNAEIIGIDNHDQEFVPNGISKVFEIKYKSDREYIQKLTEITTLYDIEIILPQTTNEICILSKSTSGVIGKARIALSGNENLIKRANDKLEVLVQSKKMKLPTVEFADGGNLKEFRSYSENAIKNKQNFYLKPKNLSGGRGVCKVIPDEIFFSEIINKPSSFHLMPYSILTNYLDVQAGIFSEYLVMNEIIGDEYSVDLFFDEEIELIVPRKRVVIRSGISHVNIIEKNELIINASRILGKALGLQGIFGLQFILDPHGFLSVIECNPRIQGTNYATLLAGSNLIEYEISRLLDLDYEIVQPKWNSKFYRISSGAILK